MWFQHDGAPTHYGDLIRDHLNQTYEERWIGRGGPTELAPWSPDLTQMDFFFGGV